MPFVHGKNAFLEIDDVAGAAFKIQPDLSQITLAWSRDNPITTTFGQNTQQRLAGIRDVALNGTGVWNGDHAGASAAAAIFDGLMAASIPTLVKFAPGGSISGCPLYTACMLISSHETSAPVNGVVTNTFAFQIASGSLTTGSCA